MKFRLCLNTSTIRPVKSIIEKIQIAIECGFDGIELWHDDLTAYEKQSGSLDDIKKLLDDNNLEVVTTIALHGWVSSIGSEYEKALDDARTKMKQSAAIGAKHIIASPPREVVSDMDEAARRYRHLLELGREFGVKPAMEFLGFAEGINQINDAWEIVTKADHPDSAIVLDSFHIYRGGSDINDMKQISEEKIAIFHINDAPQTPAREKQTDADRVYPGDGILPLSEMVQILRDVGYTGHISLELFNPKYWAQNPKKVVHEGLDKMRAILD
jgi:sugar phosphate isomerase/epimerase